MRKGCPEPGIRPPRCCFHNLSRNVSRISNQPVLCLTLIQETRGLFYFSSSLKHNLNVQDRLYPSSMKAPLSLRDTLAGTNGCCFKERTEILALPPALLTDTSSRQKLACFCGKRSKKLLDPLVNFAPFVFLTTLTDTNWCLTITVKWCLVLVAQQWEIRIWEQTAATFYPLLCGRQYCTAKTETKVYLHPIFFGQTSFTINYSLKEGSQKG